MIYKSDRVLKLSRLLSRFYVMYAVLEDFVNQIGRSTNTNNGFWQCPHRRTEFKKYSSMFPDLLNNFVDVWHSNFVVLFYEIKKIPKLDLTKNDEDAKFVIDQVLHCLATCLLYTSDAADE